MTRVRWLTIDAASILTLHAAIFVLAHTLVITAHRDWIGLAALFDLTITASAFHFVFGVRFGKLPVWTLLPIAAAGLSVARALCPVSGGLAATVVLAAAVTLEGLALMGLALRGRRVWISARQARLGGATGLDALEAGLCRALPAPLAGTVRTEVEVLWFAASGFFRSSAASPSAFSMHRESGWIPLATMLALLSVMEGALLHWLLFLAGYGWTAAAISGLQAYGILWLCGDVHALRLNPCRLEERSMQIRFGLRWRCDVPWELVEEVAPLPPDAPFDRALKLLGSPNVLIELIEPVTLRGIYGIRRTARRIAIAVDEPERFRKLAQERMASCRSAADD